MNGDKKNTTSDSELPLSEYIIIQKNDFGR